MKRIITFVGLPGSGKTTFADMVREEVGGARINADQIRATISNDLKFSLHDRRVQASRMGALAAIAVMTPPALSLYPDEFLEQLNKIVVVDFICPTHAMMEEYLWSARMWCRDAHHSVVWMNTIKPEQSRFPDTAKLYEPPANPTMTVEGWIPDADKSVVVDRIIKQLNLRKKSQ